MSLIPIWHGAGRPDPGNWKDTLLFLLVFCLQLAAFMGFIFLLRWMLL